MKDRWVGSKGRKEMRRRGRREEREGWGEAGMERWGEEGMREEGRGSAQFLLCPEFVESVGVTMCGRLQDTPDGFVGRWV